MKLRDLYNEIKIEVPGSGLGPLNGLYQQFKFKLKSYFEAYELTDDYSFWREMDNFDMYNNIAAQLADEDGLKDEFYDDDEINSLYHELAVLFSITYAKETGVISKNENQWVTDNPFGVNYYIRTYTRNGINKKINNIDQFRKSKNLNEIKSTPDIKVKNPNYYQQLVDQSNGLSQSQRNYFKNIIDSIKSQDNLATQRQFDILKRIEKGDFKYHTKN